MDAGPVVEVTAQQSPSLPDCCAASPTLCRANRLCDGLVVGLILWTLVHTTEALAAEQTLPLAAAPLQDFDGLHEIIPLTVAMSPAPAPYLPSVAGAPGTPSWPAHDFRARPHTGLDGGADVSAFDTQPTTGNGTVWQRLSEFRTHDRFRVVTLWETGGNSLSLQAGRKGDPTLQWTSRLTGRGPSTRGLLDDLFSRYPGNAVGRSLHLAPRQNPPDQAKPVKPFDSAVAGTFTGTGSTK